MAEEMEIRRAPKLLAFGVTGFLLGAIASVALFYLIPNPEQAQENALGLFIVYLGGFGAAMGVVLAIIFDLVSARKTKKVIAERQRIQEQKPAPDKVSE